MAHPPACFVAFCILLTHVKNAHSRSSCHRFPLPAQLFLIFVSFLVFHCLRTCFLFCFFFCFSTACALVSFFVSLFGFPLPAHLFLFLFLFLVFQCLRKCFFFVSLFAFPLPAQLFLFCAFLWFSTACALVSRPFSSIEQKGPTPPMHSSLSPFFCTISDLACWLSRYLAPPLAQLHAAFAFICSTSTVFSLFLSCSVLTLGFLMTSYLHWGGLTEAEVCEILLTHSV